MNKLVEQPIRFSKFNKLLNDVKTASNDISILGLSDSQKAHIIYSLYNYSNKLPVIVCPNVSTAKKMIQDLKFYSETEIVYFPSNEVIYYNSDIESREIENQRVYAINKMISGEPAIIVTTIEALMQKVMQKETYLNKNMKFRVGESAVLEDIVSNLVSLGYKRQDVVESSGQFAVRGGLLDIFPANESFPYRIEFFGDEIDSIRKFDTDTQKSTENIDVFELSFSNEYIISDKKIKGAIDKLNEKLNNANYSQELKEKVEEDIQKIEDGNIGSNIYRYFNLFVSDGVTLFDYIDDRVIYFDEISRCIERSKAIIEENNETIKIMIEKNEVHPDFVFRYMNFEEIEVKYKNLLSVYLERINKDRNLHAKRKEYSFSCREVNFFRSSMDVQINEIKKYLNGENLVVLVFSTLKKVETIKNLLLDNGVKVKEVYSADEIDLRNKTSAYILSGIISSRICL